MTQADSVHSTPPINASVSTPIQPQRRILHLASPPSSERGKGRSKGSRRLRERARNQIDKLLEFLDASDIDPDLEPTPAGFNQFACRDAGADECEIPEDEEPSLGSFDRMIDQDKAYRTVHRHPAVYGWSGGADNEQDDCDYEPSAGSLDGKTDQTAWAAGDRRDLEQDPAESGIGEHDGQHEQPGTQDWQQGSMG